MPSPFLVSALGARVEITFDDGVSDQDAARFASAWEGARAPMDGLGPNARCHVTLGTTQVEGAGQFDVAAVDFANAAAALSTRVTLAAIEHQKSQLVMLHACGVAASDGTVFAFVGPSGRGKTTLVTTLGKDLSYVTDETVGIDALGRVRPYRKPLSRVAVEGVKEQLSPGSLGLLDLPDADLRIGAVFLLDRQADWRGAPRIQPVGLVDALTSLVPELSYLPLLDKPLHRLAELIERTGGVNRLTYAEADSIDIGALRSAPLRPHPESWIRVPIAGVRRTAPVGLITRVAPTDGLRVGDALVLLHGSTVRVVDGIGPAIWDATAALVTLEEITRYVVERHGSPIGGGAAQMVTTAVSTMAELGLLNRG